MQNIFSAAKIIDISPVIGPQTAVFPGDTPFSREVLMSTAAGEHLTLSAIKSTLHIGAHTDAPNHYSAGTDSIEKRPLEIYLGPCQVIEVSLQKNTRITPQMLKSEIIAPRVLFKTDSFPSPTHWTDDFMALSGDLVDYLAKRSVKLVGIDTPSIDLADDKLLEAHGAVARNDMAILEGIVLKNVSSGLYTLVALPLPIFEGDASPVRAVLLA